MKPILLKCAGDLKLYCHKVFSHVTLSIFECKRFECAGRRHDPLQGGIRLRLKKVGVLCYALYGISTYFGLLYSSFSHKNPISRKYGKHDITLIDTSIH